MVLRIKISIFEIEVQELKRNDEIFKIKMLEFEKYKVDVGKLEREFDEGVRKFE